MIIIILFIMFLNINILYGQETAAPDTEVIPEQEIKKTEDFLYDASVLRTNKHYDSAIGIYQTLLKDEPKNTEVLLAFADMMIEMRNYSYAVLLYKRYLEVKPEDVHIRTLVIDIYNATGSYAYATEECLNTLKTYGDNKEIINKLLDIYKNNKSFKEETALTEKLLEFEPDNQDKLLRLLDLYMITGSYKKAYNILERQDIREKCSHERIAFIYLNTYKYKEAIELYEEIYRENPSEENENSLNQARLSELNYNISRTPYFYSAYYNQLTKISSGRNYGREMLNILEDDISGIYTGGEYSQGSINNQDYINYYAGLFYPVMTTGTEILLSANRYKIKSDAYTGIYNKGQLDVTQHITENFSAGGGYSGGTQGSTYYGEFAFKNDILEAGIRHRKDFVLETVEAMKENISYNGMDYYTGLNLTEKCSLLAHVSDYDYSDGNNGTYSEIAAFYRLWDNRKNTWITAGISHTGLHHTFESPLYYSPLDLSQWNYSIEWDIYWTENSLFRVNYMHSSNELSDYNIYSMYIDHKIGDDFFLYGEYIKGLSRVGRIGVIEPDTKDYELTLGLKAKF